MSIDYTLLDVFADAPFQGTQIPVVVLKKPISESHKIAIAGEFKQTETVFLDQSKSKPLVTVYNDQAQTQFGAHTALAASYIAYEMGLSQDKGRFATYHIDSGSTAIESFIDKQADGAGRIQFSRSLAPFTDAYTPETSRLAAALGLAEKHLSFSKYKPMVVSVDQPILIVGVTRPEHVLSAKLNAAAWRDMASEVYAAEILLFAPGSISGSADFHGRLLSPTLGPKEFPPIGKVMPEFIAYLAHLPETKEGTHTFVIDRGSENTRVSVIHAEFDKRSGKETRCRIGGHVIKMGKGSLLVDL